MTPRADSVSASLRLEEQQLDRYSDQQLFDFSTAGVAAHSYDRRFAVRLGAAYGVTRDLAIGIDLPWVDNQGLREANLDTPPDLEHNGSQSGLGDGTLFGQLALARAGAAEDQFFHGLHFR